MTDREHRRASDLPTSEAAFLAAYDQDAFEKPSVTVDVAAFAVLDATLKILLIRRGAPPFRGAWALPGGFVRVGPSATDQGESLEAAAERELLEETFLRPGRLAFHQVHVFGAPKRDPRTRVISVLYATLIAPPLAAFARAGSDADQARFWSVDDVDPATLAFDHAALLDAARGWLRRHCETLAATIPLCDETFSIAELRATYEAVHGVPQDPANFQRRFSRLLKDGLVEQAKGARVTGRRRAKIYRRTIPPRPAHSSAPPPSRGPSVPADKAAGDG